MTRISTRDQVPQIPRPQAPLAQPAGFGSPPPGPQLGGGLTGKDILRILRKRLWLILISFSAIMGVTCVATALWYFYAPLYTAVAQVVVQPAGEVLRPGARQEYGQEIMNRIMRTHAAIAVSNRVLNEALKDSKVVATDWYQRDKTRALDRLRKKISVAPIPGTNYIRVSMRGKAVNDRGRTELAEIVNAVAEEFENASQELIKGERTKDIDNLKAQRDELNVQLNRTRIEMNRLLEAGSDQESLMLLTYKRRNISTEMDTIIRYESQAISLLEAFNEQVNDESIDVSKEVQQALDMDPTLRALRGGEMNAITRLDRLQAKYGKNHNEYKAAQKSLESIKSEILRREGELKSQAIEFVRNAREAEVELAKQSRADLQDQMDAVDAKMIDMQVGMARYKQLSGQEKDIEAQIARLNNRLLELQAQAAGEVQVRLALPAIKPREVSMPKWIIMIPLGIVAGAVVGLGLAFLLEFIDTSIKGPSDIARRVDLPLLGMVPHSDDLEEEIEDARLAFMEQPDSLISEAFRQIRTCLRFSGPANQQRSLLVASPLPEDGRTTVAVNLAACCAQGGKSVLVVDANFRQPAIGDLFSECPEGGLSSVLVGQARWEELVHESQPGMHVLPAGVLPPNPAELLGSEQMRQLISEMTEKYDQVLIDSAPCLLVSDSLVLSTLVDGVIMVVRAGANTYGIVQRTRDVMQRVGSHIVGVVLNAVRASAGGYLRENYERFYEYHTQRLPVD